MNALKERLEKQLAAVKEQLENIYLSYETALILSGKRAAFEKPAEWSEEDEMCLSQAIETLEHENYSLLAEKLKSLRPQPHSWSKEDRRMLDIIISELEQEGEIANVPGLYHLEIDFLKSIRPSWKPSEEQMSMLLAVINDPNNAGAESCYMALKSIYNNLKKLM